ncbi:GNAT family N-acetyltransferase [Massilia sp. YIM B04103]|uniref:GNAT family N-acetyltransferase n=1 Tax=Massilia sp. YIM B04103 TaxID=2963106 RepID=UPI00210F1881|nr:GNAT family N-acetyltransferase [Massilia sp. YIM B04103]
MPRFTFRRLHPADMPLLHDWLNRPHIRAWWDEPGTLEQVSDTFMELTGEDADTLGYIALLDGEPAGFIQSYVVMGSGGGWWEDETDPGARGIDLFLADGERLGQGLGSALLDDFCTLLFSDPAVSKVQADPTPANGRAIRSYQRAGFRDCGEVVTPDGPARLMVRWRVA